LDLYVFSSSHLLRSISGVISNSDTGAYAATHFEISDSSASMTQNIPGFVRKKCVGNTSFSEGSKASPFSLLFLSISCARATDHRENCFTHTNSSL